MTSNVSPRRSFLFMGVALTILVGVSLWLADASPKKVAEWVKPAPHPETERFTHRGEGVGMIDPLKSQSAAEQVMTQALGQGANLTDRQAFKHPGTPKNPPGDLLTMVFTGYPYCRTSGRLTVEFFNDRLYEAVFEPQDPKACRLAMEVEYPNLKSDANGRAALKTDNSRVVSNLRLVDSDVGRALGTRPQVIWQDNQLMADLNEWDKRFGV